MTGHPAPVAPPPPLPGAVPHEVQLPAKGDLCAWRRTARNPAEGFGIVLGVAAAVVELVPLTGSPSHSLRRPLRDVRVLVRHDRLVAGLLDELSMVGPW